MGWIIVNAILAMVFLAAILAIMFAGIRWEVRLSRRREAESRQVAEYLAWRDRDWAVPAAAEGRADRLSA
ncbi:MAG: hypothetical protein ACRD0J_02205 [Acidimicrobiales bacterium]